MNRSQPLSGKISDRIRAGLVGGTDINFKGNNSDDDPPPPNAVQGGSGYGLGKGATRARNGDKG